MSVESLYLIKKKTDNLEQTKTSSQETLEFQMKLSRQTICFDDPLRLVKDKWLFAITTLELYNSIFHITKKMKSFRSLWLLD